jgi:hypothetical protein
MLDPKLNELPADAQGDIKKRGSSKQSASRGKAPQGLSINDTIARDANLSVGSRGADFSGVESGAGAGAGMTSTTPGNAGESPAPNIVPGARGVGTTPRSDSASGQSPTGGAQATTSEPTSEEIARRAYQCWHERGCPEGSPEVDWCRAEEELRAQRTGERSQAAVV